MALKTDAVGKEWPGTTYQGGREKIKEYANALGIENPVHFDVEAAREAGFRDVVAPPMFAVVYSGPALGPVLFDPEAAMYLAPMGRETSRRRPAAARSGRGASRSAPATRSPPSRSASRSRSATAKASTSP